MANVIDRGNVFCIIIFKMIIINWSRAFDCPFEFIQHGDKVFWPYLTPVLHRSIFINKLAFGNSLLFVRYIHNDKWFPTYKYTTIVPDNLIETVKKTGEKITVFNQCKKVI